MKLAVMQPYFFPYIGYWQLIHAADHFVLFDDAQYMRHGWVNRNRILKPGGSWQYILVPLKKHKVTDSIKTVQAHPEIRWRELIIRQLAHYKNKAIFFDETREIVEESLFSNRVQSIAYINFFIIKNLCSHLGISKEITLSSEHNFDYSNVSDAGEWALRIAEQIGASEYINPISGESLFSHNKFALSNVKLSFLKPQEIEYNQGGIFEPFLSIIDTLMYNGIEETKILLRKYTVESSGQ